MGSCSRPQAAARRAACSSAWSGSLHSGAACAAQSHSPSSEQKQPWLLSCRPLSPQESWDVASTQLSGDLLNRVM